jgi:DNA-binding NarL/FixJ family response regulator
MPIRVLLADDHTVVRDGLHALLSSHSEIEVVGGAGTGRLAVQMAQNLHPDVVVMDISMPGLNGIDAAANILAGAPGTRVIILSMLGTPEHVHRALQVGVHGYLLKESAGREVIEAILAVHSGGIYLSQPVTHTLVGDYLAQRSQTPGKGPLESLSEREREILLLVVEGRTSAEIAAQLHLSQKTVESYRSRMMQKLGVPDLTGLIKFAIQYGLISLD